MDPWLEKHWRDIHAALITYARDSLNVQLPGGLRARMEERVFVESPLGDEADAYPDIRVVEYKRPSEASVTASAGQTATQPIIIEIPKHEITESFIQVIDTDSGNKVVTTIEFLSPSHKRKGSGQQEYLEKQQRMMAAKVNLVEIDLLRRGERILILRPAQIPPRHRTCYQACVWRAAKPTFCEVIGISLRSALPEISVPLRASDKDATLNLQALVELAYQNGRYDSIDYTTDPIPPLDADDAAWAHSLLKAKGKR